MTDKELDDLSLAADDYVREHFAKKATKESSAGTDYQQTEPKGAADLSRAAGPDTGPLASAQTNGNLAVKELQWQLAEAKSLYYGERDNHHATQEQLAEAKARAIAWERKTVEAERWQSIAESKLEAERKAREEAEREWKTLERKYKEAFNIQYDRAEAAERLAEFGVRPDVHALAVRRAEAAMFERVKHQCAALAYSYSVGCSNKILHLTE